MREKQQKQMPLISLPTGHPREVELEMISKILDKTPNIYDHVLQDCRRECDNVPKMGTKSVPPMNSTAW